MSARALYSNSEQSTDDGFNAEAYAMSSNFYPGEPIGPRRAKRRLRKALNGAVMLAALGAGWQVMRDPVAFEYAQSLSSTAVKAASAIFASRSAEPTTPLVTAPPPVEPLASNDVVEAPAAAALAAAAPVPEQAPAMNAVAAPEAVAGSSEADATPAPLAPPKIDPADPYQKRAVAVGLHPDLSRVLLSKLTPADYKNASIAIKTALAETPDSDKFVWPKKSKADLALFEVHFVRGSASDCRRYVVTVTKDGWLTTALPMEKCGINKSRASSTKL
jgi:hypothetical protein